MRFTRFRQRRIGGTLAAAITFAVGAHSAKAQTRLDALRSEAKELQYKVIGRPCTKGRPVDCNQPEAAQLAEILREYIAWKLSDSKGNTDQLLAELRTVDDVAALEILKLKPLGLDGHPPFVFRGQLPLGEVILAVNHFSAGALAIPPGIVIIQAFRKESDRYVYAASTGDSIYGIMNYNSIELLDSPVSNEIWLLVAGQVAGFMGDLERARIYAFDGYSFREVWAPEDRQDMRITVKGDRLSARYLGPKIYRFGGDRQDGMLEELQLTPAGAIRTSLADLGEGVLK